MSFNFVSGRTLESELTSSIAALMAGCADLPITEFKVNRAPTFTTLGIEEETLAFPDPPMTLIGTHIQKITKSSDLFMTIWPGPQIKRFSISNKKLATNRLVLFVQQLRPARVQEDKYL